MQNYLMQWQKKKKNSWKSIWLYQPHSICNATHTKIRSSDGQDTGGGGWSKQSVDLRIRILGVKIRCTPMLCWTYPAIKVNRIKPALWLSFNPIAWLFVPPIGRSLLSHGARVGCYHPIRRRAVFWRVRFRLHPLSPASLRSLRTRQQNA